MAVYTITRFAASDMDQAGQIAEGLRNNLKVLVQTRLIWSHTETAKVLYLRDTLTKRLWMQLLTPSKWCLVK